MAEEYEFDLILDTFLVLYEDLPLLLITTAAIIITPTTTPIIKNIVWIGIGSILLELNE